MYTIVQNLERFFLAEISLVSSITVDIKYYYMYYPQSLVMFGS